MKLVALFAHWFVVGFLFGSGMVGAWYFAWLCASVGQQLRIRGML